MMMAGTEPRDPDDLLADARCGDVSAWFAIVEEIGPLVRGYLRAVGDPDPDAELVSVFDELADNFDVYSSETDEFVVCVLDITVARQRSIRRALPNAPTISDYARPATQLHPDMRDAVLLQRLGRLDTDQVADILGTSAEQVRNWQIQGSALIADGEWGIR